MSEFNVGDKIRFDKNIIEYNMDRTFVIENVYGEFVSLREIPNMKFHYTSIESMNKFKYGDIVYTVSNRYMVIGEPQSSNYHLGLYDIVDIVTNTVYKKQDLSHYILDTIRTILSGSTVYHDGYPYVADGDSYFEYDGGVIEMVRLQLRDRSVIFKEIVVNVKDVITI